MPATIHIASACATAGLICAYLTRCEDTVWLVLALLVFGTYCLCSGRGLLLACVLIGFSYGIFSGHQDAILRSAIADAPDQLTLRVKQNSFAENQKLAVKLALIVIESVDAPLLEGRGMQCFDYDSQRSEVYFESTELLIRAKIRPISGLANPAGFDFEDFSLARDIVASCTVLSAEAVRPHASDYVFKLRQRITSKLSEHLTSREASALMPALMVGDRRFVDPELQTRMMLSGIAHLMAISGLHIGLLAALGWVLGRGLFFIFPFGSVNRETVCLLLSLTLAFGYSLLAGPAVPTIRAMAMLSGVALLRLQRQSPQVIQVLWIVFAVFVWSNPSVLLESGFWLSFCAVAALIFGFYGRFSNTGWFAGWIKVQLVLFPAMAVIAAVLDLPVSLAGPLNNLLVVPLIGWVVVPLGLLSILVIDFLPGVAGWLLGVCEVVIDVAFTITDGLSAFPHLQAGQLSLAGLLLSVVGAVLLLLPKGIRAPWPGLVLLIPVWLSEPARPDAGDVQLTVFDVGQGLAVLVQTRNRHLLYDTGPQSRSGWQAANSVIRPYLAQQRISHLDALVVSHADADHAGGVSAVLDAQPRYGQLRVDRVYASRLDSVDWRLCEAGQNWQWDGVQFQMIHPTRYLPYLGNDSSCVILISTKSGHLLLSGDISSTVEQRLIPDLPQLDLLLVPHHGSLTSSSEEFLDAVEPQAAIVSAAAHNRFNHPSSEVVERYLKRNVRLMSTAECGMLRFLLASEGQSRVLWAWRQRRAHLWDCWLDHSRRSHYRCEMPI